MFLPILFSYAINCPNFSGHYVDEENQRLEIQQVDCNEVTFISEKDQTKVILDGKERPHQTGRRQVSFIKGEMSKQGLTITEFIREKDKPLNIYKMILDYHFKNSRMLLEETHLFDKNDRLVDQKSMTLQKSL